MKVGFFVTLLQETNPMEKNSTIKICIEKSRCVFESKKIVFKTRRHCHK
jgi:hypothetical protein